MKTELTPYWFYLLSEEQPNLLFFRSDKQRRKNHRFIICTVISDVLGEFEGFFINNSLDHSSFAVI